MNYKLGCLMFILAILIPLDLHGFPQRSDGDIAIQDKLTNQINESPNDPHLRFELAMEYASRLNINDRITFIEFIFPRNNPYLSKCYNNIDSILF